MIRIVVDNDTDRTTVLDALEEGQLGFLGTILIQFDHGDHLSSIGGAGRSTVTVLGGAPTGGAGGAGGEGSVTCTGGIVLPSIGAGAGD